MRKLTALLLVLFLLAGLAAMVCANPSPTGTPEFIVDYTTYEHGDPETNTTVVPDGDTWTVTVDESEHEFSGFTIEGEYELIEGSLDGPTIIIRPLTDLVIIAEFEGVEPKPGPDDGPVGPSTGINPIIYVVVAVVVLAAGGALFATKRLARKEH